jgi:hypothetical protein
VRSWLGEAEGEFNLLFAVRKSFSPEELAAQLAGKTGGGGSAERAALLERAFHDAGVTRFCYGALVIQRHEDSAAGSVAARAWTMRTKLAANTGADSFEAVFERSRACARPSDLADWRPRLAPAVSATVVHRVDGARFVATAATLETEFPFGQALRFEPWVFPLTARFDGSRSVATLYAEARAEEMMPAGVEFEDFCSLTAMLIVQGFLTMDEA